MTVVEQQAAALIDALRSQVRGEVRFDVGSRAAYATDSSNYRQPPQGVVVPADVDDAVTAMAVCATHQVAVTSRGGGTSLAGQTTNHAVILDWSKHCHRLVSVQPQNRTCVVEPGIALDELNRQLAPYGLMFGPRPSTHRSCTLGGMIGNNSCGSTAQAYGKTVDNVRRLEILTYDGTRMWVGPTSDEDYDEIVAGGGRPAEIYQALRTLRDAHLAALRTGFPHIPRRVSGYNLPSLLPEQHFDLARALVGSEGTLVTVLHAELELVEVPAAKAMVVLGYPDIAAAGDAVPDIVPHGPWQLEGLDQVLLQLEQQASLAGDAIGDLPAGGGWLMIQFAGRDQADADTKAHALLDALARSEHRPTVQFFDDPAKEDRLIEVREAGLGATAHPVGKHETWEGWEDAAVPPDQLGDYLRDFRALLDDFGYDQTETSLYGHFGQGCVHTRIPFELRTVDGIAHYRSFVEAAADLVVRYGGSLSGEHGDGQSRGELLTKMFDSEVIDLFGQVKQLFDPTNRMNPGKVVHPNPLDGQLRLGLDFAHGEPRTFFAYPKDDHRFSQASLRCVGIGSCRTTTSDDQVMCPSYMVTREEEHSTRGRARLLFEMVRGETITTGWRSAEVRDALDLCLACKGCKSDCPVNVDMATYKAEFLAHHYAHRLRPRAHYSMGWLPVTAQAASRAPALANAILQSPAHGAAGEEGGWCRPATPAAPVRPGVLHHLVAAPPDDTAAGAPGTGAAVAGHVQQRLPPRRSPGRRRGPRGRRLRGPGPGPAGVLRADLDLHRPARHRHRGAAAGPSTCSATTCAPGSRSSAWNRPARRVFRSDGPDLLARRRGLRRLSRQTRTFAELLTERAAGLEPAAAGHRGDHPDPLPPARRARHRRRRRS